MMTTTEVLFPMIPASRFALSIIVVWVEALCLPTNLSTREPISLLKNLKFSAFVFLITVLIIACEIGFVSFFTQLGFCFGAEQR